MDDDRRSRLHSKFRSLCIDNGWWISPDDRIGAGTVELLLGWKEGTFAHRLREGKAPRAMRIGGGGHRLTVELDDLVDWYLDQEVIDDAA